MRAKGVAAALAVMLWGGYAAAQDEPTTAPSDPMLTPQEEERRDSLTPSQTTPTSPPETVVVQPVVQPTTRTKERRGLFAPGDQRGVSVAVTGGVEGYSGALAPQIAAGPTWGVTAQFKPARVVGLELAYNGAVNEVRTGGSEGAIGGADLVRNGGQVAALVALPTPVLEPYVLGGVGLSRYDARGGGAEGFTDDTVGHIPLAAGVRAEFGRLLADARFGYNLLFDQQFASRVAPREIVGINSTSGARYTGTLSLGAAF